VYIDRGIKEENENIFEKLKGEGGQVLQYNIFFNMKLNYVTTITSGISGSDISYHFPWKCARRYLS
jgi:hypothetical protein